MIGVLSVNVSTNEQSILAVPWTAFGGGDITVAKYLRTNNLEDYDAVRVYDAATDKHMVWSLDDGEWESENMDGVLAPPAAEYTLSRGTGVWLLRDDVSAPISVYIVGEWVPGRACATPVKAGTSAEPSWNLVGNPFVYDLAIGDFAQDGDQIQVPTSGLPKNYVKNGDQWGYWAQEQYQRPNGRWATRSVFKTDDSVIPAGTGFWYLNTGAAKDSNW